MSDNTETNPAENEATQDSENDTTVEVVERGSNNTLVVILLFATIAGILLSYLNIDRRLGKLEQSLNTVETSLPALPQATIDAIIALQNGEQPSPQASNAPAPSGGTVSIDNDAFVGDRENAQLAIIEFSDFNCPFCARFHAETLDQIMDSYVRSGKAIYVYRDYVGVGGNVTLAAAAAAECVKELSDDQVYLELVNNIYGSSGTKNVNRVKELAAEYPIDAEALDACIQEDRYRQEVVDDTRAGQAIGARGTPAFIIGTLNADGTVSGDLLPGAQPFEVFERVIEEQLAALN